MEQILDSALASLTTLFETPELTHTSHGSLDNAIHVVWESLAATVNLIGALIIIVGVMVAILNFFLFVLNISFGTRFTMVLPHAPDLLGQEAKLDFIRVQLATFTLFGLEVLVSSDILDTLTMSPTHAPMDMLLKLGIIIALRTILSYFLAKEMEVRVTFPCDSAAVR